MRHPRIDPQKISVHRRFPLPERDRGDRCRRVRSDPRQLPQFLRRPRQFPAVLLHHPDRRSVQVPDAAVVPKSFPELQIHILFRLRQRPDIRQCLQKPLIITLHRLHARLLQHDLREPYMIRRRILPPRQDPAVLVVPPQKLICMFCHLFLRVPQLCDSPGT